MNPGNLSEIPTACRTYLSVRSTPSGLNSSVTGRATTRNEHREIRTSNPAELAEYAADGHIDDSDDTSQSYVDLGVGDDHDETAGTDEFGSFDADDQVELDAA